MRMYGLFACMQGKMSTTTWSPYTHTMRIQTNYIAYNLLLSIKRERFIDLISAEKRYTQRIYSHTHAPNSCTVDYCDLAKTMCTNKYILLWLGINNPPSFMQRSYFVRKHSHAEWRMAVTYTHMCVWTRECCDDTREECKIRYISWSSC